MDTLRKTAAVGPGSLASTLLTIVVGAGLPPLAAMVLFYGGLIAMVLLCAGIGEKTAVRILFMARESTEAERIALAPITSSLWQLGLGPPVVHLYVAQKAGAAEARAAGRRSVIVSSELELAIQAGRLPQAESLALIVHAASLVRDGHTRSDPAIAFWSLPWCVLRTLLRPFSRRFGVFAFAWRVRGLVAGVAIYQCITTGPPVAGPMLGAALAVTLALSYLAAWWSQSWRSRLTAVGDGAVVEQGLGPALAAYLRRSNVTPERVARIQTLEPTVTQSRLRLVRI